MNNAVPRTILLIEDDGQLQAVLQVALANAGYRVVCANDGSTGLNLIAQEQPNLVLSDVMMPNMDGVEFFNAIQDRLMRDDIPIILMTALERKPWFALLEREGAVFLHKPFPMERLLQVVEATLL